MPAYRMHENGLAFRFNKSRAKVQVMGGGFGNGKTAGLCIKAIQVADNYPGANMLLGRSTYPKLNDTLRKEFFKWIPKSTIRRFPTKDDNTAYLHNGTTINFRYVSQRGKTSEDGQTTSNLLSATYDFIGIDQIEDPEIVEKDFNDLFGRLRGTTPYRGNDSSMPRTGPRWLVVTCNPTSNWFYRTVVKPYQLWKRKGLIVPGLIRNKTTGQILMELFEGPTHDNVDNLPDDFIEGMESRYVGQMYDRYILGKWGAYEGLVYPNFVEEVHMLDHGFLLNYLEQVGKDIEVVAIEGYDFGLTQPSCYLFGFTDSFGRVFIVDGYYKGEYPIDEQSQHIYQIRDKYKHLITVKDAIIADPDLWKKKAMAGLKKTGIRISDIFKDEFNLNMKPGDNTIDAGITKVSSYLNGYNTLPPLIPGEKSRLIYFSDELGFIRDEFSNYFWKTNPQGEREDVPMDRNDHSLDVIKYILSYRPKPGEIRSRPDLIVPAYMHWNETYSDDERERMEAF